MPNLIFDKVHLDKDLYFIIVFIHKNYNRYIDILDSVNDFDQRIKYLIKTIC